MNRKIQIELELFLEIYDFICCMAQDPAQDPEQEAEKIKEKMDKKLDKLLAHLTYSKYKRAITDADRNALLHEYLKIKKENDVDTLKVI